MLFRYLLALVFCITTFSVLPGQNRIEEILNSGTHFETIVQQADAFFAQKYPGLSPKDLSSGEYRDGTFVKYMRWKHYWKNKLNSDGTLGDPTAYFRKEAVQSRNFGPYDEIPWFNIALPENLGGQIGVGRTTSVAFHPTDPDIFWVSTAIGGIWKTLDGGETYISIADNLPTLAVSVVLVDQSNPDIIYAATGDRVWYGPTGIGVYKSIDGGQTWEPTAVNWALSSQRRIYAMAAKPGDPNTIFAATDNGLYFTSDGFETVTSVSSNRATDVKFKPSDPNTIYYTGGNFFWKSTDGGENFDFTSLIQGFARISVSAAEPERVSVSSGNTLYHSYDSGVNFSETKDIADLGNGDLGYVIHSQENADVLYGGYFNTWKSTDNGDSWSRITCFSGGNEIHVDNHFAAINPLVPNEIFFCNDGGLYKFPENACNNCNACFNQYVDLSAGMKISQYYDISNSQQNINIVAGGTQDNGSFYRNQSGDWQFYAPTGDGMVGHIDPSDDTYRYWTYQLGTILRNVNGNNFCISCNLPNGEDGNGAWVTPYALDFNEPSVIIAAYRRVYRSTDRGNSWLDISGELANGALIDLLAVAPSNSDVVYAYNFNTIYKTSNATAGNEASWTSVSTPTTGITSMSVHPHDDQILYLTKGGYSDNAKVYVSYDAGENWENISGSLPNVPANVIKPLADDNYDGALFVGTDAGVFYLDNTLEDWVEYGDLPHTEVSDIEFQYNNQLIRIGTHGRSIFEAPLPLNECLTDTPPDEDGDGICDSYDVCPGGDDNLDLDEDGLADECETYCQGAGSAGTGADWISLVALNTISNSSDQTFYSDFTSLSTDLIQGQEYELQVGLNFSFDLDVAYAWIDFNQNRDFDEEELINMSDFDGSHQSFGTVFVPEDAILGETILRVRNIYGSNPSPVPCSNFFGEVEDYTIQILEGSTNTNLLNQDDFSLEVRPNPAIDQVEVILLDPIFATAQLEMRNTNGQLLWQGRVKSEEPSLLDISHLATGVYFIHVNSGNRQAVQRFIKQ